ncbi:MAG: DUF4838 domain-containing protein [Alistipes sp.]|nr:DUF4838 domain-containing protein [Alistipes sp.]
MKRFPLIILVAVAIAFAVAMQKPTLFNNGKSDYAIVLCKNASTSEQTAAKELQGYLEQIGGVALPIITRDQLEEGQKHILIGYNKKYGAEFGVERPDDNDEGFTYRNVGDNIWIYGGSQRGTMYGVYSFLENELGVRWYTKDYTKVPSLKKWSFKELNHSESPFIEYRFDQYFNVEPHKDWLAHNKCNSVWRAQDNEYGGLVAYWNAHTFEQFIPSGEYFSKHPEYFSLRDGKRTPYTQLCLSNPEVLQICIEKMKQAIADNPLYWVYSMSQSDNQFPCQCEKCRAIEEQYGGHSGLMIWFVNQVADAIKPLYPDKYIGTFAYQYTRKAPVGITPRDNVVIRLCSIECCFAHPLEECEHNHPFISDIEDWSKIAPHLFIWDYVVNYRQYVAPFPNFGVLAENIKTFKKYNAIGIQEEAQYESIGGEFSEMKSWVLSKLLWNPNLDTKALVAQFITDYYGNAAPYIQQYFDLCHSLIKDDTVMGIYIDENNPLYTDEFVTEANSLLTQAKKAVAECDEDIRFRVDLVGLQIDYLRLLRTPQEAAADGTRDRVFEFVRKHNILFNEWQSVEETINIYNNTYANKQER